MLQISWNTKDFKLEEIGAELREAEILDGYRELVPIYHIFGVKNDATNPHITLVYQNVEQGVIDNLRDAAKFLAALSLTVELRTPKKPEGGSPNVKIGVRLDIRKNVDLAFSLIASIIHMSEGQVTVDQESFNEIKKTAVVYRKRELAEIGIRQEKAKEDAAKLLKLIEDFEGLSKAAVPQSSVEEA